MNNANISGGKKTRQTIKTSKEIVQKKYGRKVREKDKNQHTWKNISNKSFKDKE